MARWVCLLGLIAVGSLVGCGGATTAVASSPPFDAGAGRASDDAALPEDGAVPDDASVPLDAALFPEAGTSTACALTVSAPPAKSFQSGASSIDISGTEIPFPHFECGEPATGDPYWVLVTMAPDEDGTASVGVYLSDAWNATAVGGGTCAIALASDGVPITVEELMAADAGSIVTAAFGNCVSETPAPVVVTSGWIRAALDAVQ